MVGELSMLNRPVAAVCDVEPVEDIVEEDTRWQCGGVTEDRHSPVGTGLFVSELCKILLGIEPMCEVAVCILK